MTELLQNNKLNEESGLIINKDLNINNENLQLSETKNLAQTISSDDQIMCTGMKLINDNYEPNEIMQEDTPTIIKPTKFESDDLVDENKLKLLGIYW